MHADILKLSVLAEDNNIQRIAEEMIGGTTEENLNLLEAFMSGFDK